MADPADLVQEACERLAGYLPRLEELLAEPSSTQNAAAGMSPRPADTPEPWDAPVGRALMDAHEGVRRLEAVLKYLGPAGRPGARRPGSPGNTAAAMAAIPKLAAGLSEDVGARAARYLEHLINSARAVQAIDEGERWRYVQARACPRCGCWALKVLLDEAKRPGGRIECFGHHAESGAPCRATWARLADMVPDLARADELAGTMPDLEG